jgi:hypothetical protein
MLTLTYEYKLIPTKAQIAEMEHILEVCISVWNYALRERKDWIASRKCPVNACSLHSEYIMSVNATYPEQKDMKLCGFCKVSKSKNAFSKNRATADGLSYYCKECLKAKSKENYAREGKKQVSTKRLTRLSMGLCGKCDRRRLPSHQTMCEFHFVKNSAAFGLGKSDNATTQALLDKLSQQNRTCSYTGDLLQLGVNAHLDHIYPSSRFPELANSLDNVEWVSVRANLAKGDMTKNEFLEFCELVVRRTVLQNACGDGLAGTDNRLAKSR